MSSSKRTKAIGIVIVALLLVMAGLGLLYVKRHEWIKGSDAGLTESSSLSAFATGSLAKMVTAEPVPASELPFRDADGNELHFSDFEGKVTVVNLWATWCAPCKLEMPTLAALAKRYEGREDFMVAAISMDAEREQEAAKDFIGEHAPLA